MRLKDESKRDAIFHATVYLLNKIGFNNISMSKIAKEAGVSPSTLYVYFDNKEDMLQKIYVDAKQQMVMAMCKNLHENRTVHENILQLCKNILDFSRDFNEYLLVIDQLSFTPLIEDISQDEIITMFQPIFTLMQRGVAEGLLKNVAPELLIGFCYYPITQISKEQCSARHTFEGLDDQIIIDMCWDAVKK